MLISTLKPEGSAMIHAAPHLPDPPQSTLLDAQVCLGRTCLAWEADGELSQGDVHLILERLCLVDEQACKVLHEEP